MTRSSLDRLFQRLLLITAAAPAVGALSACSSDGTQVTGGGCMPIEVTLDGGFAEASASDAGNDGGDTVQDQCASWCGFYAFSCSVVDAGAPPTVSCQPGCTGRRPAGLLPSRGAPVASALGAYFAEMARLEAASVDAFRILRDELAVHGAPRALRRAAGRAARDEIRHARMTAALSRRYGGRAEAASAARRQARSLVEIARENAVEGCVRETFGALVATWQAKAAGDPVVRAAMERIARDELRHAALAWDVARWARGRLDREGRRQVDEAQREGAAALAAEQQEPPPELVATAGVPRAVVARRLAKAMERALWQGELGHMEG